MCRLVFNQSITKKPGSDCCMFYHLNLFLPKTVIMQLWTTTCQLFMSPQQRGRQMGDLHFGMLKWVLYYLLFQISSIAFGTNMDTSEVAKRSRRKLSWSMNLATGKIREGWRKFFNFNFNKNYELQSSQNKN